MKAKVGVNLSGKIKLTLTDIRDGSKQVIEKNNMLLNSFFNRYFTQQVHILGTDAINRCYIGTGSTPPTPQDEGLSGSQLAMSSGAVTETPLPARSTVRFTNPDVMPPRDVYATSFSSDGTYLAVGNDGTSNNLHIYKRDGDVFTRLSNPDVMPPRDVRATSFSPDGTYLAVGDYGTSNNLHIYKRDGDVFTRLSNPDVMPPSDVYATSFSSDGTYLAVGNLGTSPYLHIYKRDGDVFTRLSNPDVMPPRDVYATSFSSDGTYLAVGNDGTSNNLHIYKRDGDVFTRLSNPDVMPPSDVYAISFSSDGTYLAVGNLGTSNNLHIYKRDGDVFTRLPNPNVMPQNRVRATSFSSDGTYLAVGNLITSPYLHIYKRDGDVFTRLSNPDVMPRGSVRATSFSPDGNYLAVGNIGTSNNLHIYKRDGDINQIDVLREMSYGRRWTFPAGVGTGVISEVALRASTATAYGNGWVARQVLDFSIEKTEFQQLDVEWEITAIKPPPAIGVIPNGAIDGSDVSFEFVIQDFQFYDLIAQRSQRWLWSSGITPAIKTSRFGEGFVKLDTLNSNVTGGQTIQAIQSTDMVIANTYTQDSMKRTARIYFNTDQMNGDIKEMVCYTSDDRGCWSIFFDPPLQKVDTHRLYIDIEFSLNLNQGGE